MHRVSQNLYTTRLDVANNKMTVAEADRLAKEIMASKSTNRHTAEERGYIVDDSGVRLCPELVTLGRYQQNCQSVCVCVGGRGYCNS